MWLPLPILPRRITTSRLYLRGAGDTREKIDITELNTRISEIVAREEQAEEEILMRLYASSWKEVQHEKSRNFDSGALPRWGGVGEVGKYCKIYGGNISNVKMILADGIPSLLPI